MPDSTPDTSPAPSASADATGLDDYTHRLAQALQILDLAADHRNILDAANGASATLGDDAGVLTAFYIGYAAGSAPSQSPTPPSEKSPGSDAVDRAADIARRTIAPSPEQTADPAASPNDSVAGGWAATAQ